MDHVLKEKHLEVYQETLSKRLRQRILSECEIIVVCSLYRELQISRDIFFKSKLHFQIQDSLKKTWLFKIISSCFLRFRIATISIPFTLFFSFPTGFLTLKRTRNIILNEKAFLGLASSLEHSYQQLKNQNRMIGQRFKYMQCHTCSLRFQTTRRRSTSIQITGITILYKSWREKMESPSRIVFFDQRAGWYNLIYFISILFCR